MARFKTVAALALATAFLCGCADIDPERREGMWQPEGVNAGNLAAMVVDPMDLARGRGTGTDMGDEAVAPIAALQKNGPGAKPLGGGGGGGSGGSGGS